MSKRILFAAVTLVVALALMTAACSTGSDSGPAEPVITEQTGTVVYSLNAAAEPLTVTATAADGGTLSYQWYSAPKNDSKDGTAIPGATEASYTPPTDTAGMFFYYVVVSNGTARTASDPAVVWVR